MKKLLYYFAVFSIGAALFSCSKEEVNVADLTDFPPGILSIAPADNGKVVIGGFDVKVIFVDGTISPLSSGTIRVLDGAGNELTSVDQALSGTMDSIVIEGTSFNAGDLPVGNYSLEISVLDSKSQETTRSTTFEISNLPFAANYNEMYLAGSYNGWGADPLELIADHTWYAEVEMDGGEWKLKNTVDWTDQDWGDPDGDGLLENTTGGGPNSAGSPVGMVKFTLNDATLRYTIEPLVTFESNIANLYLLGTFNDFEGTAYQFAQTDDNLWELDDVLLNPDDKFKFSEGPNFMGKNWGDNDLDGVADEFGSNITFGDIPGTEGEAFYNIDFNDKTLEYSFEFNRFPSIGIIGSATPGGWDADTDMNDNGDGTFSLIVTLVDGEAKFRANDSWDTNWGGSDFPTGVATQDGPNIPVTAGTYDVQFNPTTGEYDFKPGIESLGIIGSATPGGWDSDTDLMNNGDGTYSLIIGLTDGEAKFRINDNWDDANWGGSSFPNGTGEPGGANIPVTKGIYRVDFNFNTLEYSFTPASIGIIGSATPGGWDNDTDMTEDDTEAGLVTLTVELFDGEAKFRAQDEWTFDWGGSDFPSGTADFKGPNIPITAGTYTVKFNVNTGAYAFE